MDAIIVKKKNKNMRNNFFYLIRLQNSPEEKTSLLPVLTIPLRIRFVYRSDPSRNIFHTDF